MVAMFAIYVYNILIINYANNNRVNMSVLTDKE